MEFGTTFVDESEKRVGNLRGQNSCDHSLGLGLMRTAECSKAQKIGIKSLLNEEDIKIFVTKPAWWPQEAPKNTRGLG